MAGAPRLLFESTLIMLSVLMGFTVNEYRERQKTVTRAAEVVTGFRREIQKNLRDLEDGYQRHQYFQTRLAAFDPDTAPATTAITAIIPMFPKGGLHLPVLSDAAWQTATATDAFRLLDYKTVALLSETYLIQRDLVMGTSKLIQDRLFERATFDRSNTKATLLMISVLMEQLTVQEKLLIESSRAALAKLPAQ
jgi:hypothetical protein